MDLLERVEELGGHAPHAAPDLQTGIRGHPVLAPLIEVRGERGAPLGHHVLVRPRSSACCLAPGSRQDAPQRIAPPPLPPLSIRPHRLLLPEIPRGASGSGPSGPYPVLRGTSPLGAWDTERAGRKMPD